jgi:hypothetical protein
MSKLICFIVGHKINLTTCPYTKNIYTLCKRCGPKQHTAMSFH